MTLSVCGNATKIIKIRNQPDMFYNTLSFKIRQNIELEKLFTYELHNLTNCLVKQLTKDRNLPDQPRHQK